MSNYLIGSGMTLGSVILLAITVAIVFRKNAMSETRRLSDAIEQLQLMHANIAAETWADERGKRHVLTGIKMSITKLRRMI